MPYHCGGSLMSTVVIKDSKSKAQKALFTIKLAINSKCWHGKNSLWRPQFSHTLSFDYCFFIMHAALKPWTNEGKVISHWQTWNVVWFQFHGVALNLLAKSNETDRAEWILSFQPNLHLFVWNESHLSICLNASTYATHTYKYMGTIYNCTPTLYSVKKLLSLSTHQKESIWHWTKHLVNANNVIGNA